MAPSRFYNCTFTQTIPFKNRPGLKQVRDTIDAFFGTDGTYRYDHLSAHDDRVRNGVWQIMIPGKPTVDTVDERWIEVTYDNDSYCGKRDEPYVMFVTVRRQDPLTISIAEGFALYVAARLNGSIVDSAIRHEGIRR